MSSTAPDEVILDEFEVNPSGETVTADVEVEDQQPSSATTIVNTNNNDDDAETITYIQIECDSPDQIFAFDPNDLESQLQPPTSSTPLPIISNQDVAVLMTPIQQQHDTANRIPPWAFSTPKYPTPVYTQSPQIGSSLEMPSENILAGVRPTLFRPRQLIPFPGTNGYPKYDDVKLAGPQSFESGPVSYTKRYMPPQISAGSGPLYQKSDPNLNGSHFNNNYRGNMAVGGQSNYSSAINSAHSNNPSLINSAHSNNPSFINSAHSNMASNPLINYNNLVNNAQVNYSNMASTAHSNYSTSLTNTAHSNYSNMATYTQSGRSNYNPSMTNTVQSNNHYSQMGSGYSGSVVVSSTAFQSQTSAAPHLQSGGRSSMESIIVSPRSCPNTVAKNYSRKRFPSDESITSWDTNNGCLYSGKKQRMIFSDSQCARLREAFTANPYLSKVDRGRLAVSLDLAEDNVSVWFKNHRSKLKKKYHHGPVKEEGVEERID